MQNFVMIELELRYQHFLRRRYNCELEVFQFPANNWFNKVLEDIIGTLSYRNFDSENNKFLFKIGLPAFEKKNPEEFRYFSEIRERIFKDIIKKSYEKTIGERIRELMSLNMQRDNRIMSLGRQGCLKVLIYEFGIDANDKDAIDQIKKLFNRYKAYERVRKCRLRKAGKSERGIVWKRSYTKAERKDIKIKYIVKYC